MSLVVKNLSKRIDQKSIINDVSFEVDKGEIFGVFGPGGIGKSILLSLLAGTLDADGGEVFADDVNLAGKSPKQRGLPNSGESTGSIFQKVFRSDKNRALADGEAQALELDSAMKNAEKLLLLDNQFAFIDRRLREQKVKELKEVVKQKQLSVVFATNDLEEIFTICDRVAILDDGKFIQTGTPREVYEAPKTVAVARATGRSNVIEAQRVSSSKSDIPQFITITGEHRVYTDKLAKSQLSPINQNMNLAIRPEHISLSFGASFPEDNLLKAEITEITYLGATTLIGLNANGLTLKALVLRLVGLNIGDECMVGLPPDRILVLKD